jgi:pilus assembly protein CpaB
MNRATRHMVVLAIAVLTASLASFAVYQAIVQIPARNAEARQSVVVATRPMIIGTQLTARDVKVVEWPADSPIAGAIGDVQTVLNRGLLTAVLANEPITHNKLAAANAGGGLSPAIPRGMRAMSVRVNDVIGVAGFVVPGTHVDVVVTMRHGVDSMTRTAASNVEVLTSGTRQDQSKPEGEVKPASNNGQTVVTLMVSPSDAERITLAQSEGEIMLVLRNPLDTDPTVTTGVRTAALLGQNETPAPAPAPRPTKRVVAAPPPAPAPPPAEPLKAEAIRAGKRTDEVIR